ncbi:MAG: ABC transporter ATP-binding protein [Candidatus Omnitrophica bacterium]|nr:ABC transporter ATP-binding protein [Candidatus Omnitrophota bacterium]
MSENIVKIQEVSKSFGREQVIKDLSCVIPKGSVYGLLGRNGQGKTTLLKCLLGLICCEKGTIEVLGQDPLKFSNEIKARIGYVAQKDTLYSWLSAREFLDYVGSFYPRWNESFVAHLAKNWDVRMEKDIGVMSEGERQKVSLLAAIGHEPDLLVLDEPVASLDPAMRREFIKAIVEHFAGGRSTVIFSTHITSDIERIADRVGVINSGHLIFDGNIDDLKDARGRGLEDIFVEMTQ